MLYSLRCVRVWPIKLPISGRWAILMSASRRCDWRGDTAPAHAGTLLITYSVCGHLSDRAYLCSVTLLCRLMFSSAICVVQCDQLWGAWRSFTYRAVPSTHCVGVFRITSDLFVFSGCTLLIDENYRPMHLTPDTHSLYLVTTSPDTDDVLSLPLFGHIALIAPAQPPHYLNVYYYFAT